MARWLVCLFCLAALNGRFSYASELEDPDPKLLAACGEFVAHVTNRLTLTLLENDGVFVEARARITKASGITRERFYDRVERLIMSYNEYKADRLQATPIVDGEVLARQFIRGVLLWSETETMLFQANEVFYHLRPRIKYSFTDPYEDFDLVFFAIRMAWLAECFDRRNEASDTFDWRRRKALRELHNFDNTAYHELNVSFDHERLEARVNKMTPDTPHVLASERLNPPLQPITSLNLQFNNGKAFHLWDLQTNSPAEFWIAQRRARGIPDDILLGLGDNSTRQFFRLFRMIEGYMSRFDKAADYVYLRPDGNGGFCVVFDELKFSPPHYRVVPVEKALEQHLSSWQGWVDAFGVTLPVCELNLLVPMRDPANAGSLGKGFHVGRRTGGRGGFMMIQPLLYRGQPVPVEFNGQTIFVNVMQFDISKEKFDELDRARQLASPPEGEE